MNLKRLLTLNAVASLMILLLFVSEDLIQFARIRFEILTYQTYRKH